MTKPTNELENFILQRLQKLGMSKAELMRRAGLSRTVYYTLIANRTDQTRLSTIFKLADALKLHPMTLLWRMVKAGCISPDNQGLLLPSEGDGDLNVCLFCRIFTAY